MLFFSKVDVKPSLNQVKACLYDEHKINLRFHPYLVNCPYLCNLSKNGVEKIWIVNNIDQNKEKCEAKVVLLCNDLLGFAGDIALIKGGIAIEISPYRNGLERVDPRFYSNDEPEIKSY